MGFLKKLKESIASELATTTDAERVKELVQQEKEALDFETELAQREQRLADLETNHEKLKSDYVELSKKVPSLIKDEPATQNELDIYDSWKEAIKNG